MVGRQMSARKRIDIGWFDLLYAGSRLVCWDDAEGARMDCEQAWSDRDDSIVCLSVRSGFDLYLSVLELPEGSEVLVSAVTILDMVRIVEEHGLVPVPVDLNLETMAPDPEDIAVAITPKTRAILFAHLFGTVVDISPIAEIAQAHHLVLIEDCAQAYAGNRYRGHPDADVSMFSFGPIKTSTALAGGILTVRDSKTLRAMQARQSAYPVQPRRKFGQRVMFYSFLKWLGGKSVFGVFVKCCKMCGVDFERLLSSAVRNFPSAEFFYALRQRPNAPMCRLLRRRILLFDDNRLDQRSKAGWLLVEKLRGLVHCPGTGNANHCFWIFPISVEGNKTPLIEALRQQQFDANASGQLRVVPCPGSTDSPLPSNAECCLKSILFLPLEAEMKVGDIEAMSQVIALNLQREPAEISSIPNRPM